MKAGTPAHWLPSLREGAYPREDRVGSRRPRRSRACILLENKRLVAAMSLNLFVLNASSSVRLLRPQAAGEHPRLTLQPLMRHGVQGTTADSTYNSPLMASIKACECWRIALAGFSVSCCGECWRVSRFSKRRTR
ncbi:unnamed protein product [Rangifer tarandus platyrhynchus]|uniref:Uncharacterized protein n=1 Tax=Rangifer tarandus platyrhynchus TaxID=3082113 RepID=A0ABN8XIW0_RANTA|nr:unnamed protein product [Rangifer tarandus platyrhynchus]